jgi:hypothetical protein
MSNWFIAYDDELEIDAVTSDNVEFYSYVMILD